MVKKRVGRPPAVNPKHDQLLALWRQGFPDPEIADAAGVTVNVVRYWRKTQGLASNRPRCSPVDEALRWELYKKGLSDEAIASALGVTRPAINAWRWRNGLAPNAACPDVYQKLVDALEKSDADLPRYDECLCMSDDELLCSYRQAKSQREQVRVLADLNACPVKAVIARLKLLGADLSLLGKRYKKMEDSL